MFYSDESTLLKHFTEGFYLLHGSFQILTSPFPARQDALIHDFNVKTLLLQ